MKKILENLEEAEKINKALNHLLYVTYPIILDQKIFLRILTELHKSLIKTISAILQYEYILKRIKLYQNPKKNFEIFEIRLSKKYKLSQENIQEIKKIFYIIKEYHKTKTSFPRKNNLIILDSKQNPHKIDLDLLKKYLKISNSLINELKIRKV